MKMETAVRLGTLVVPFVLAAAGAWPAPPGGADGVRIQNVTYGGSGCKRGTVAVDLAEDARAFTILFSAFLAETGPFAPNGAAQSICDVHLTLDVPRGSTYAITAVDYRGFARITTGERGRVGTRFQFPEAPRGTTWQTFAGPYNQDWRFRYEVDPTALDWSKCNVRRAVNLHTRLLIDGRPRDEGEGSLLTVDSQDGTVAQTYHLAWARCGT